MKFKKRLSACLMAVCLLSLLSACCISHEWKEATCTEPRTCQKCEKTEGESIGHVWAEATCSQPKTCQVCKQTEGVSLEHTWEDATCATPKTCKVCNKTEGKPLAHSVGDWEVVQEATLYKNGRRIKTCIDCHTVVKTESIELSLAECEPLFDAEVEKQEVRVVSTKYIVRSDRYKSLYPDMLQAIIQNDSKYDIKNAVIAFVAWDKNNLPIKIIGSMDFSDGHYVKEVMCRDINLVPGKKYGNDSGFSIDDGLGITTFKAIVVSYEAFSGETWQNPLYSKWVDVYAGVKLPS